MWSVLGPALGAVLAAVGAYWLFRAKVRSSETDRVRSNLRKYIRDVSLAHRWLKEDVGRAASRSPEAGGVTYQQEATRRATALYKLWDEIKIELQSPEITMALDDVNRSIDAALRAVSEGNFAPDLAELKERRDRLASVVRKRLAVRL